jgi:hypothetical protein
MNSGHTLFCRPAPGEGLSGTRMPEGGNLIDWRCSAMASLQVGSVAKRGRQASRLSQSCPLYWGQTQ